MKKSRKGISYKRIRNKRSKSKSKSKSIRSKKSNTLMKQKDFLKMYKGKEKEYYKNYELCVRKCHKISSKKKNIKKGRCFKSCNDKRLKNIQNVQKNYPKEWIVFLNNL